MRHWKVNFKNNCFFLPKVLSLKSDKVLHFSGFINLEKKLNQRPKIPDYITVAQQFNRERERQICRSGMKNFDNNSDSTNTKLVKSHYLTRIFNLTFINFFPKKEASSWIFAILALANEINVLYFLKHN